MTPGKRYAWSMTRIPTRTARAMLCQKTARNTVPASGQNRPVSGSKAAEQIVAVAAGAEGIVGLQPAGGLLLGIDPVPNRAFGVGLGGWRGIGRRSRRGRFGSLRLQRGEPEEEGRQEPGRTANGQQPFRRHPLRRRVGKSAGRDGHAMSG